MNARRTVSEKNSLKTYDRVAPIALKSPISRRRSFVPIVAIKATNGIETNITDGRVMYNVWVVTMS